MTIVGPGLIGPSLELPAIVVSGNIVTGGAFSAILELSPHASGTIGVGGVFSGTINVPIEVSGTIYSGSGLVASLIFPAIHVDALIAKNTLGFEITHIPVITLSGTIISGGVVSGEASVPVIKVLATVGHYNALTFDLDLPEITTNLFIVGAQRITVQGAPYRKAFAMNLSHFGVTEYSGYSFNSFANYHFSKTYIGASEEGIFVLDGDDDNGVRIESTIQTGNEDLWADVMKRLREGFVVKRGGPVSVTLILDEGRLDPVTLNMETVRGTIEEERVRIPRGIKNRFVSFVLRNSGGNDLELESFRVMVDPIKRKRR